MCRSTLTGLKVLEPRVMACFEAGALASGTTSSGTIWRRSTPTWRATPGLLHLYRVNAEALGRTFGLDDQQAPRPTLSTDMANVSLAVPDHPPPDGNRRRPDR